MMERLRIELARPLTDGYYALSIIECHESETSAFIGAEDAEVMRHILREHGFISAGIKDDDEYFMVARKLKSGGVVLMLSMYEACSNSPTDAIAYFLAGVGPSEAPPVMALLHYSCSEFLLH